MTRSSGRNASRCSSAREMSVAVANEVRVVMRRSSPPHAPGDRSGASLRGGDAGVPVFPRRQSVREGGCHRDRRVSSSGTSGSLIPCLVSPGYAAASSRPAVYFNVRLRHFWLCSAGASTFRAYRTGKVSPAPRSSPALQRRPADRADAARWSDWCDDRGQASVDQIKARVHALQEFMRCPDGSRSSAMSPVAAARPAG